MSVLQLGDHGTLELRCALELTYSCQRHGQSLSLVEIEGFLILDYSLNKPEGAGTVANRPVRTACEQTRQRGRQVCVVGTHCDGLLQLGLSLRVSVQPNQRHRFHESCKSVAR